MRVYLRLATWMAICFAAPRVLPAQIIFTEEFTTDGNGARYELIRPGSDGDDGFDYSFNVRDVEFGGQFTFPSRRVAYPWSSTFDDSELTTEGTSSLVEALDWVTDGGSNLNVGFLAQDGAAAPADLAQGDRAIYDLLAPNHTLNILDGAGAAASDPASFDFLVVSDAVIEDDLPGSFLRYSEAPVFNYDPDLNNEMLITTNNGSIQNRSEIQVRDSSLPVSGGIANDTIVPFANSRQPVAIHGTPRPGLAATSTYRGPEFTTVETLAAIDAMIAGFAASMVEMGTIDDADLYDNGIDAEGNWRSINNLVPGVDEMTPGKNYGFVATGKIDVTTGGTFTFGLSGDDGGRLRINGEDIVVDDATHDFQDRIRTIDLPAGEHDIEWVGFQHDGEGGWEVSVIPGATVEAISITNGWDVLSSFSGFDEIGLAGPLSVSAYFLDSASSPFGPTDESAIIAVDAGTTININGFPFRNSSGEFLYGRDMDDGDLPDGDEPKGVVLQPVDVSELADPKVSIALAANLGKMDEDEDYIRIYADPDADGPAERVLLDEFLPVEGSLTSDEVTFLTPNFKDFSYDLPSNSSNVQVTVEVWADSGSELLAFDNIRISDGPIELKELDGPQGENFFQQGVNGYEGTVDTEVRFSDPDDDLSTRSTLNVDGDDDGGPVQVLIRFEDIFGEDEGQIPLDASLESATLTFEVGGDGDPVQVHRMLQPWDDTATFNSLGDGIQPNEIEAAQLPDDIQPGDIGQMVFDVTMSMQAFLADPSTNYGWVLIPTGSGGVDFSGEDTAALFNPLEGLAPRLDFVLGAGTGVCGDFDLDGDVDAADRTIQTVGWTGAIQDGGTATFAAGDCDGDGDVDTADQTGLIGNWTGAMAGNLEDGDDADLVYDPTTGNVTIDASDTDTGLLISFVVGTDQNNMDTTESELPFIDVGTNTDNQPFQIGQTDPLNQGAGPSVDLGNILPTGMDLNALSDYLTIAEYASALGSGGTLDLRVVPEPSTLVLLLAGALLLLRTRKQ